MDYSNIVTFIINNKQYYLYYDLVKDLPIFEELKKSDKVETIEYPGEINHKELLIVFDFITKGYSCYDVEFESIFRIYAFMKYLTIDYDKIKTFILQSSNGYKYDKIVDYIVEHNYDVEICGMINYDNMKNIAYYIKNFTGQIKPILIDYYVKKLFIYNYKREFLIYQKKFHDIPIVYQNFTVYKSCFGVLDSFTAKVDGNKLQSLYLNGKQMELVNVPETIASNYNDNYYVFNVYDTIVNHIKQVLLGQVEL